MDKFVLQAKAVCAENQWKDDTSPQAFWRYFSAVIGHGIVQFSEEREAYVAEKSSVGGLLGNKFLHDMHTFEEWWHAKQMFWAPLDELTTQFNSKSKEHIQPSQYVGLLPLLLLLLTRDVACHRKIAVDEGGRPSWANSEYRKYTPGKPHPNAYEYLIAVDQNGFSFNIKWPQDNRAKYDDPESKLDQMVDYLDFFAAFDPIKKQPYVFYIDSRWSSLKLLEAMHDRQLFGVLSCGENMAPKVLWPFVKSDLGKYDWWTVGLPRLSANLACVRTKDKVYLKILSNYCPLKKIKYKKRRRKYPMEEYWVPALDVQREYNAFKCKVDMLNKALLEYYRLGMATDDHIIFTHFYFHLFVVQCWNYYNACTNRNLSQLQFRLQLLDELRERKEPPKSVVALAVHWPESRAPSKHRCQFPPCHQVCTMICVACDKWGCSTCLRDAHLGKK